MFPRTRMYFSTFIGIHTHVFVRPFLKDIDFVNVSMATDYFREFYEENLGGGLKIQRRRTKSKL